MVNHGVKREGSPTRKPRTEPNLIQEVVPETGSDNGLDDHLADAHAAGIFYQAALDALEFPPQSDAEEEEEVKPLDDAFLARIQQMELGMDGSDVEQGGASDAESYGKVASDDEPEPAPYRVLWFSIFGLWLWLKLGFPSICPDYSLMGFTCGVVVVADRMEP